MKLKEKLAEVYQEAHDPYDESWLPLQIEDAYQAGWDACAKYLAEYTKLSVTYPDGVYADSAYTDYTTTAEKASKGGEDAIIQVDKASILAAKDVTV